MIVCYRIAPTAFNNRDNALQGRGGYFAQGRWHYAGQPVVYTAQYRSLAMLERLVNDDRDVLRTKLSVTCIQIPETVAIKSVSFQDLSKGWNDIPYGESTQMFGTKWLKSLETAVLKVPSSLCHEEHNYLINPDHPDAGYIECLWEEPYSYPDRLANKLS